MFPEDWQRKPIGKICASIVPGRNKPKAFDGDIPWVTTPEIVSKYIPSIVQKNYISADAASECGAKIVPPGSVVIAAVGQLGLTAITTMPLVLNQQLHAFICPDYISNEYLAYWLSAQKSYMDRVASKTTILYMNKSNCEGIPVAYPVLKEQTKIAKILSTWDQAIETTGMLIENSKAQKKALMQQLLTGKKRLPGFGDEWQEYRFNQIFDRLKRKNTVGNDNVLTISGKNGLVSQKEYFKKRVASKNLEGYTLLHRGDFAYNKSYSNGYPYGAIKPLDRYDAGVVSSLYICFYLIKPEDHDHDFFRHFFEGGYFDREIYAIAQEGARNHGLLNVSSTDFFVTRIRIPSLKEQTAIAEVINTAEAEQQNFEQQLTALQLQKKALMQQLLTGKLRVKVEEYITS